MIRHHPPLELLFDYGAGSLPEPAALVVADRASTLPEGVEIARNAIDSGAAHAKVEQLALITHGKAA